MDGYEEIRWMRTVWVPDGEALNIYFLSQTFIEIPVECIETCVIPAILRIFFSQSNVFTRYFYNFFFFFFSTPEDKPTNPMFYSREYEFTNVYMHVLSIRPLKMYITFDGVTDALQNGPKNCSLFYLKLNVNMKIFATFMKSRQEFSINFSRLSVGKRKL